MIDIIIVSDSRENMRQLMELLKSRDYTLGSSGTVIKPERDQDRCAVRLTENKSVHHGSLEFYRTDPEYRNLPRMTASEWLSRQGSTLVVSLSKNLEGVL